MARIADKAWDDFVAWCRVRRLKALPAHPWTVAAYLRWCDHRRRPTPVVRALRAIARAHVLACMPAPDHHPTVTRTLRAIEARDRNRADRAALFSAADFTAATPPPAPAPPPPGRRAPLRQTPKLVPRRPPVSAE